MRGRIATITMLSAGLMAAAPTTPAIADAISQSAIGTYTFGYQPDTPAARWVLSPCDNDTARCVKVSQYGLTDSHMERPNLSGIAYWAVGSWVMVTDVTDILTCPETEEKFTLPATYSWDATTSEGFRSFTDPGLCGGEAKLKNSQIFLTKVGPEAPPPATETPAPPAAPPAPQKAETATPPAPEAPVPAPPLPALGAAEAPTMGQ